MGSTYPQPHGLPQTLLRNYVCLHGDSVGLTCAGAAQVSFDVATSDRWPVAPWVCLNGIIVHIHALHLPGAMHLTFICRLHRPTPGARCISTGQMDNEVCVQIIPPAQLPSCNNISHLLHCEVMHFASPFHTSAGDVVQC